METGKTPIRMEVRTAEFIGKNFRGHGRMEIVLSCVKKDGSIYEVRDGFEGEGTRNQLAIEAVIKGLKRTRRPCRVELSTDCGYLNGLLEGGSLERWEKDDFMLRGKERPNAKELRLLLMVSRMHDIVIVREDGEKDPDGAL